jgi:putative salt-induced outer membrane protein YdiY
MINRLFVFVFFCGIAVAAPVQGDEVTLTNGDRITGKLVRLEEDKLVLSTDFAGEISIQADKVTRLVTEAPVTATLLDGSQSKGTVFTREVSDSQGIETRLAEVKDIYTQPKPRVRLRGRANAGVSNERGNTDTDSYRLDAEMVARTEKQRFTAGGEFNREKADGTKTVENWKGYGRYDYFFQPKWFLYGSSLFEHDEFADLDLRTTLGAGLGHQFFESEELNLSASAGVAYIIENYDVADDEEFPGGQWQIQYDQYFFNKRLQLFHQNRGYISLEDADDWKIDTSQGVRIPLVKGFVSTFQYDYDYNHNPSPGAASKWDSKVMVLLGYEFSN